MNSTFIFTSESTTAGHPDKLCDQISDELVGRYLQEDRMARISAESAVSTGILFLSVKAASTALIDIPHAARSVMRDVGYTGGAFDGNTCTIITNLGALEEPDPRVDETDLADADLDRIPARENVTLFGYACTHTPTRLPLPIWCAHRLVRQMDAARNASLAQLSPDGKCQVGIEFRGRQPHRIDSITLIAGPQADQPPLPSLRADLYEQVVRPAFADLTPGIDERTRVQINPIGVSLEKGPVSHAGLTGRKNGIDTYGSFARQSGAALSGKDPSRIDRIGAYAARHAACNVVAAGLAAECEVQLSYSVGIAAPVSIRVTTFASGSYDDDELTARVAAVFDFRPAAITRRFNLRRLAASHDGLFYRQLALYGHVGRTDLDLPWEDVSSADRLRN